MEICLESVSSFWVSNRNLWIQEKANQIGFRCALQMDQVLSLMRVHHGKPCLTEK